MRQLVGLITALGVLVTATPAQAEDRALRVAIVSAVEVNMSDTESLRIANELAAALSKDLAVDIIAGADVNRRLPDGKLPEDCLASAECIAQVAERLDADQVLFLAVVQLGDRIQIDPTWSDATGTRTVSRQAMVLEGEQGWGDVFAAAATRLLPDATQRPDPTAVKTVRITVPAETPAQAPPGRQMTTGVWIAGGIGAAALVGAVSFSFAAKAADNKLQDAGCESQPCDANLVDSLERRALTADLLWGAAAAAGITAGVLYYLSDRDRDAPRIEASILPDGAGLVVKGAF